MRLDYTLYILAALLFIVTIIPFAVTIEGVESETRSLWVVTTVVLGLLSVGLGYSQRPKTKAQACEPAAPVAEETKPATPPTTPMEAPKKEELEVTSEKAAMKEAPTVSTLAAATLNLTQVNGIGEKRANQLKALGINSVDDLSKASATVIAKKLKISAKTAKKWIANAKELVE